MSIGSIELSPDPEFGDRSEDQKIIDVKSAIALRASCAPVAGRSILCNKPGVSSANLHLCTYRHPRRFLFPGEPESEQAT